LKANEASAVEIYLGTELHRRSVELTRLWLDRLRGRLDVNPLRIFPSSTLLNHIPEILKRISEYLISGGSMTSEQAIRDELALLARLRREQGYDIDEIVAEFDILGEILYQALREEAEGFSREVEPDEAIAVAERLYRALMEITGITAATFREEGFKDRRERARLLARFGRTLAHEIRNSLGAGEAAMELLARAGNTEARERSVRILQSTFRRLDSLSEDILALAVAQGSEESAQGRRLSLRKLVEEAILGLETVALEHGVRIEAVEPIPDVQVDATRVELILINLLSNAIKYSDRENADRWVRISAQHEAAGFWRLAVADNGLGIPEDLQPLVFDEFVRAHPEVSDGTGLGLAIAREATEQIGGTIWLESRPGDGTTVYFTVVDPPMARE